MAQPDKPDATSVLGVIGIILTSVVYLVRRFWPEHKPPLSVIPSEVEEPEPPGSMLLIVDDEPAMLDVLRDTLEPEGYQIFCSRMPIEALEEFRRRTYNVILVDLNLKSREMSGLEFIRAAQKHDEEVTVLIITGSDADTATRAALRVGACGFILKGAMRPEKLRSEVQRAFDISAAKRE